MSQAGIRGVVQGNAVILQECAAPLPDGTEVVVTPIVRRRGDPEALFAALDELPPMTDEDARRILWDIAEADAGSGLASIEYFIKFAAEHRR